MNTSDDVISAFAAWHVHTRQVMLVIYDDVITHHVIGRTVDGCKGQNWLAVRACGCFLYRPAVYVGRST